MQLINSMLRNLDLLVLPNFVTNKVHKYLGSFPKILEFQFSKFCHNLGFSRGVLQMKYYPYVIDLLQKSDF